MKKLVTGATGFIGSAIARELLADGQEVKVLARKTSNLKNVLGFDVEIVYGDICDKASMKEAFRGCDTLYFTAGAAMGIGKVIYTSTNNAIGASGPTTSPSSSATSSSSPRASRRRSRR